MSADGRKLGTLAPINGLDNLVVIDLDKRKADSLLSGKNYIQDIPDAEVANVVKAGTFRAQSDYSGGGELDVIYICVPTPFTDNKEPDISFIKSAAESISKNLRSGQLIILKSTTYPNTTEGLVLPILEATGKKVGKDFFLELLAFGRGFDDAG